MNTLEQLLLTPDATADMIRSGATLAIAGDEDVLAALPNGNWIGGTIPYFMGQNGGITSRRMHICRCGRCWPTRK